MTHFEVVAESQKIATLKTATKKEAESYIRKHLKLAGIEHMSQKWFTRDNGNLIFCIPEIKLDIEFVKVKINEELVICS